MQLEYEEMRDHDNDMERWNSTDVPYASEVELGKPKFLYDSTVQLVKFVMLERGVVVTPLKAILRSWGVCEFFLLFVFIHQNSL